jgi:phytoene desaturase
MSHHFPTKTPKRVIVIGGGMAGLASAARLAKKGHKVTLFEAGKKLGGKCQSENLNGFIFDTGPSLLTLPAVYRDLFIKTGKRLEHLVELQPVDPSFEYVFHDGKRVLFPNLSHNGTVNAIKEAFGDSAAQDWHNLLTRAEAMWESSRESFIEGELKSVMPLLKRKSFLTDLMTIAPWKSLRTLTNQYTDSHHVRRIIDRYATYTGSDPRRVPAVLLTIAFVEEAFGAWHVRGGIGTLGVKLADRVRELGVEIHLDTRVSQIQVSEGRAAGIKLDDGRSFECDVVISNSDANELYGELVKGEPKAKKALKSLKRATPSLSGFSLLLSLKGKSDLKHHTVIFPENYDDEFDSIFKRCEPPKDPAIYICNPQDESMLPAPNHEAWFVLVNAPRHEPDSGTDWKLPGLKEEYANHIIELLEKRGISVRNRIINMEIRTPADLERDYRAPGGSIYGTSSNGMRSAFFRARNRSPIKNLYCVGGSAHPGGGLPLVALSAEIVAAAIEAS